MRKILFVFIGLILALSTSAGRAEEVSKKERERLIERCAENRGTDCESEKSINQEQMKDRTRGEAEEDGSRSIHQNAPRPEQRSAD